MEEYELTPEQKKARIEASRRKRNTNIFLFFTVILQIVVTLTIIVAMFVVSLVIVARVMNGNEWAAKVMQALMFAEFIGGLILGFMAFTAIVRFIIRKFHLEDKLTKDVLDRYKKIEKEDK